MAFSLVFYQIVLAKPQLLFLNSKFLSVSGCEREGDLGVVGKKQGQAVQENFCGTVKHPYL